MNAPIPLPVNVDTTGSKILEDDASHPDQRDSRDIYLPNHVESVSHIAIDVGGSLAKVVYFTRSRSSSDPPPRSASPPSLAASASSSSVLASPTASSRHHSRQSSANGVGAHPTSARSSSSSYDSSSTRPAPSGTLTPTAILPSHGQRPPHLDSAVNAVRSSLLRRRSLPPTLPGGRLNFMKFETSDISSCVSFLRELIESSAKANSVTTEEMRKGVKLMATGGGAHLFYELFERELGVEVQREDEMGCLITGLNFITLIPDEVFWYSDELVSALHSPLPNQDMGRAQVPARPPSTGSQSDASASQPPAQTQQEQLPRPSPNPPLYAPMFDSDPTPKLPCLLVNIGSGVSMIKVDDYGKYERVSGTSLGGGTLWGLLSLLTDAESFDEMLELSDKGEHSTVDMLVSDVYGNSNALNAFGLKSSTIASSFGKVFRKDSRGQGGAEGRKKKFRPEDICKSLLYAVSNNIGQIAYMTAEKYDLDRIYFGGCFIRGHQATISTLSYAIRFWSKGTKRAFFLRHEGYLGAIGAWIKHLDDPIAIPGRGISSSSAISDSIASAGNSPVPAGATSGDEAASQMSMLPSPHELPTPVVEVPEPIPALPTAAEPATPSALVGTANAPPGSAPHAADQSRTAQLNREGSDMLSMLNSLQEEHRSLVEPVLAAMPGTRPNAQQFHQADKAVSAQLNGVTVSTDSTAAAAAEEEEEDELDEDGGVESIEDIQNLLAQLDAADGAADGLESKLDTLLSRLDGILETQPDTPSPSRRPA